MGFYQKNDMEILFRVFAEILRFIMQVAFNRDISYTFCKIPSELGTCVHNQGTESAESNYES